jgi:hypothetical protein
MFSVYHQFHPVHSPAYALGTFSYSQEYKLLFTTASLNCDDCGAVDVRNDDDDDDDDDNDAGVAVREVIFYLS